MEHLDIHPASADERLQAFRNVFDVWPGAATIEEHVARRLVSPVQNRPGWFVGCVGGRVVTSLACHDMLFRLRGEVLRGIAIASVHTLAEFRGRGFAPQLLEWVEQHSMAEGARLSLLYSDVGAAYYGRMGYLACPSYEGTVAPSIVDVPSDFSGALLVEFSGLEHVDGMAGLYAGYHETVGIAIHRTDEYWRFTFARFADDRCFWLVGADGSRLGYVRLARKANCERIVDYALAQPADGLAEQLYGAVIRMCRQEKTRMLGGWLPDISAARGVFEFQRREVEITMVKPLAAEIALEDVIDAADRFCEVDHV